MSPETMRQAPNPMSSRIDKIKFADQGALDTLSHHFGHNAQKAWRKLGHDGQGGGGRIPASAYKGDGKGYDKFNPRWCPCPAPLKDKHGNYSDDSPRCNYHVKECGKDSVVEAAIHMEREHWDWWYNANKWMDMDENNKPFERPPRSSEVKFPKWHEDGEDPFASMYERKLAAERTRLMSKTIDREHKEEIAEAKDAIEPPKRKPGRPATPKGATEGF